MERLLNNPVISMRLSARNPMASPCLWTRGCGIITYLFRVAGFRLTRGAAGARFAIHCEADEFPVLSLRLPGVAHACRGVRKLRLEQPLSGCGQRKEYSLFGVHRAPQAPRSGAVVQRKRGGIQRPDLRTAAAISLPEASLHPGSFKRGGNASCTVLR